MAGLSTAVYELVTEAVAASGKHATMADIEHVVILIQENRSFDHLLRNLHGRARLL